MAPLETAAKVGLMERVRTAFGGGEDEDAPPLIVRRQRADGPSPAATVAARGCSPRSRSARRPRPWGAPRSGPRWRPAWRRSAWRRWSRRRSSTWPRWGRRTRSDAALESSERAWELPELALLSDAPASSAAQMDLTAKGQRIRETLGPLRDRGEGGSHPGGAGRHPVRAGRGAGHQAVPDRGPGRQPGAGPGGALASGSRRRSPASRTSASRSRTAPSTWSPSRRCSARTNFDDAGRHAASWPSRWARTWPASRSAPTWPRCRTS